MLKKLFFSILLFTTLSVMGQVEEKKTIAVTEFNASGARAARAYASSLTESVVAAVVQTNRFTVVDRTNFDDIFTEENLQKGESFIEGIVVEQGKKIGAQYIVTGNLINVSAEPVFVEKKVSKDSDETKKVLDGYRAELGFSIKIINVETGAIEATETIGTTPSSGFFFSSRKLGTKEEAISDAIKRVDTPIIRFIDRHFPVMMRIFEITDEKKGRARQIVITGGKEKGLYPGQGLSIVEIQQVEVDGKMLERRKSIGSARIISVDDDNFSTCKVMRSGQEEVKQMFDSQANIFVVSGQ